MSALPSPSRSPIRTSTQVTAGDQVAYKLVLRAVDPFDKPAHHWPLCRTRPMMSALPSPFKSPMRTSTQVTAGDQVTHKLVVNAVAPLDKLAHHWPLCRTRPMTSALPSPFKSPMRSSTPLTAAPQTPPSLLLNPHPVYTPT